MPGWAEALRERLRKAGTERQALQALLGEVRLSKEQDGAGVGARPGAGRRVSKYGSGGRI
jgi:hypothetical protein